MENNFMRELLLKENAYKNILDSVEGMLAKYRGKY